MTGAATETRRATSERPVDSPLAHPAPDRLPILHVLAATLLALGLRAFQLGRQSLWIDEIFTWQGAGTGIRLPLAEVLGDVHGPLYGVVIHAWTGLAGTSEVALRTPSLVFGVATVPVLAWLASRWLGRAPAIWAAWLAAASPFLVWYGQEARNYALLVLCTCVAGVVLLGRPGRARTAGYVLAAWAGLLSNFSFGLLAPLHLRWWMAGTAPGRRAARAAGALGVVVALALLVSPWAPALLKAWDWKRLHPAHAATATEAPLRGATTFHAGAVPYALHALAVGYTLGPSLRELRAHSLRPVVLRHLPEIAASAFVFGLLGAAGLAAMARRRRLLDAALWLGVPLLAISLFAVRNFKVFNPRYLAPAAPLVLLVVAAGLAHLRRPVRIVAALALAALWTTSLVHLYVDPAYVKEDYRDALRLVAGSARPGEKIIAVGTEDPIYYYDRGAHPVDRLWLGHVASPPRLRAELETKLAGARGSWIVLSRPEDLDPSYVFVRTMRSWPGAREFRFPGVWVWHVPGAAPPPAATAR